MAEQTPVARGNEIKRSFDMHALWRLAVWGAIASACLATVALTANTDVGGQRLLAAISAPEIAVRIPPASQPNTEQLAARSAETENETRRLAQAVQSLDADRERLLTRITTLEHSLEDITGSIRRQAVNAQTSAPATAPTTGAAGEPANAAKGGPDGPTAAAAAAPPVATVTILPQAPAVTGSVSAPVEAEPVETKPAKPEIGIDVGGAANFDGLRLLWNSTRSVHAPWFEDLHPLASARENRKTHAVELRLVVGPFADAGAASAVCAALTGARRACKATTYEGQPFSLAEPVAVPPRHPAPKAVRPAPPPPSP
jgi:hypothetical protein